MNTDLTTLKAQAYDLIATIEEATRQLNAVNAAIAAIVNPSNEEQAISNQDGGDSAADQ